MQRGIFCNRTLNLRSIGAIGYDLDYTLIHYRVVEWERRAYAHLRAKLCDKRWPAQGLELDPGLMVRGLILDLRLGNVVKADRFGYVKRACHGTRFLEWDEQRRAYAGTLVDLSEPRWVFLNTLFSLSEACMFAQLVDRLDAHAFTRVLSYRDLYDGVKESLDEAHVEGRLKAEIVADPGRFVDLDPETPLALLDQKEAGRKLLLITNSEWPYTREMLAWAFDRFLPDGLRWRDLFDVIIVAARKPDFFHLRLPLFEVVDDEGLLRPAPKGLRKGGVHHGGDAAHVEEWLGLAGEDILYVGDHIWGDVTVTKRTLRWRTALILRELEDELAAVEGFAATEARLRELMAEKERCELEVSQLRLRVQRRRRGRAPEGEDPAEALERRLAERKAELAGLDDGIAPLARAAGELANPNWGLLLRTGNDKSHLARQVERSADVYTSRVSNFLHHTPFAYFRARRGSLPHDPEP
ncbi:MAG: HAD-IG family 5'-nucleotidase [Deltaproteobacteria bacterium]|nr:HAD-IG family 5'-nucleotidase [Deltaproteobacteria bacterium]